MRQPLIIINKANTDDGSCIAVVEGCLDESALIIILKQIQMMNHVNMLSSTMIVMEFVC